MTAPVLEVEATFVSLTTPLLHKKESPRRVMLLLSRVKEGKSKPTLFCMAATSHRAPKKSMKMKKTTMHMHVPMTSPRINKNSINQWKNITLFFLFSS